MGFRAFTTIIIDTVDGPAASLMHDGVNSVGSKSAPVGFHS